LTRYETLIKAIRVNTLSKLTFDDAVRFLALLGDVFPGVRSEGLPTSNHSLSNSVTTTPPQHALPAMRTHGCCSRVSWEFGTKGTNPYRWHTSTFRAKFDSRGHCDCVHACLLRKCRGAHTFSIVLVHGAHMHTRKMTHALFGAASNDSWLLLPTDDP
jgi:hypothetical protein